MKAIEERISSAASADCEELWKVIKDPNSDVIYSALGNRNFTVDMALFIAKKRSVPREILGVLASDVRFKDSYRLKIAVCRNPVTPKKITLSLLKFIKIFDLTDMTRDPFLDINIRKKIEYMITEKIPAMPLGLKTALARRANSTVLISLMDHGDERVIGICLESPVMTEAILYKLINRPSTKSAVIRMIAENRKWTLRYLVKYALIRNYHTPTRCSVKFIRLMKTSDLRELYNDPALPISTRPFIYREILDRDEEPDKKDDGFHELSGDEDKDISSAELPD